MSKHRRLPPAEFGGQQIRALRVKSYTVGSWCSSPDGTGKPEAVGISVEIDGLPDLFFRLKSPAAVDEMIQSLLRHKRDVWPEST